LFRPGQTAEFLEGETLDYAGWAVKSSGHEFHSGFA